MEGINEFGGLVGDIMGFSDGVNRKVGKMGAAVSGGQRKRIGLARALYADKNILFMDGLSEAVDKKTERVLIANILEESEKIIFVATNSELVKERATQIININFGSL